LIREQKHIGSSPVCDGLKSGKHPLNALRCRGHRQDTKVFQSDIVHMPLLPVRLIVCLHFL